MDHKKMVELIDKKTIVFGAYGHEGTECNGVKEKVIRPDSGGIYLKLVGCDYLFKGDPRMHTLNAMGSAKRIIPFLVALLHDRMILMGIGFLYFFRRKFLWKTLEGLLDVIYKSVEYFRLKPERYCVLVRELRRVSEIIIGKFLKGMEETSFRLRDILSMDFEYDLAYRYILQDIVPEINKEEFNKDPAKEIKRVFDIFVERDSGTGKNWKDFERIILLAMRINKKAKVMIIEFVNELDFDKIRLDEADRFFCLNRPKYKFWGASYEERFKMREEIWKREGKPLIVKIKEE